MLVDLKPLFYGESESIDITCELDYSDETLLSGKPLVKPVKLEGEIKRRAGVVFFDATALVTVTAPCDRCCTECDEVLTLKLSQVIVKQLENEDDSDSYVLSPDMKIDLYDFIFGETVMNLPSLHLCKDDCKGLCPDCGANLNTQNCNCKNN
ncbi:MAG: DUF177 domain-containing protein [Oscillospiraceae bacterium]|nr:DUF177 domain-containing protein [Candidatus Equicaccousia limihippi]